jgi:hypothetical protein
MRSALVEIRIVVLVSPEAHTIVPEAVTCFTDHNLSRPIESKYRTKGYGIHDHAL